MKKILEIRLNPENINGISLVFELPDNTLSNDLLNQFIKEGTKAECKIYDSESYDDSTISNVQIVKFWEK